MYWETKKKLVWLALLLWSLLNCLLDPAQNKDCFPEIPSETDRTSPIPHSVLVHGTGLPLGKQVRSFLLT